MYIVTIDNGGTQLELHGEANKLLSGKVVKGVNTIDSFSFALLPNSPGFGELRDFYSLVSVYNTARHRYEFKGRVLYTDTSMDESGLITQEVTCESYAGFLCDSQQGYRPEQNWTVTGLLQHILDQHNRQVEDYKNIVMGKVTVTDPNDNLYVGIQRENTWDTIQKKLIEKLGGEIQLREVDGVLYLDYLTEIGEVRPTEIRVSHNMKSLTREVDPSQFVTRLIPLGAKIDESENRVDIMSVNGGVEYIDDEEAVAYYGVHVGYQEWDDVTTPSRLLAKAREWMAENNRVKVKYTVKALDLSLLGLDIDDFSVHDSYPIKNHLMGVDDVARVVKKTLDIRNPVESTIEIGDSFKTLTDLAKQPDMPDYELDLGAVRGEIKGYVGSLSIKVKNNATSSDVTLSDGEEEISSGTVQFGDMATRTELNEVADTADEAKNAADLAYENLELIADGKYKGGTFIDGTNIYSPNLYGDTINLLDGQSRLAATMSLQKTTSWAFDLTSQLGVRMNAAADCNVYIGTSGGPYLQLMNGQCTLSGALRLSQDSYGTSLPDNPVEGQVYFLLDEG
ncbi:MAG: phage tail protein [Akkermansia sp.]|nr:phage tail protein [Akkermansia sp.]